MLDQVAHTVAVAKLVVVPAGGKSREVRTLSFCSGYFDCIYINLTMKPA